MNLYHKERVLSDDHIADLHENELIANSISAGIFSKKDVNNPLIRRAKIKKIRYFDYPDICESITKLVSTLGYNPYDYMVKEFNYLIYGTGDHYIKHVDVLQNSKPKRIFTSITLLNPEDEFTGGSLLVYKNNEAHKIDIRYGETVVFRSSIFHEVEVITSGVRKTLVAWIYEKE